MIDSLQYQESVELFSVFHTSVIDSIVRIFFPENINNSFPIMSCCPEGALGKLGTQGYVAKVDLVFRKIKSIHKVHI